MNTKNRPPRPSRRRRVIIDEPGPPDASPDLPAPRALVGALRTCVSALSGLPLVLLTPRQASQLGAALFAEAPAFVDRVAIEVERQLPGLCDHRSFKPRQVGGAPGRARRVGDGGVRRRTAQRILAGPSSLELTKVFWKQVDLLGTTMGSPEDFASSARSAKPASSAPPSTRSSPSPRSTAPSRAWSAPSTRARSP